MSALSAGVMEIGTTERYADEASVVGAERGTQMAGCVVACACLPACLPAPARERGGRGKPVQRLPGRVPAPGRDGDAEPRAVFVCVCGEEVRQAAACLLPEPWLPRPRFAG